MISRFGAASTKGIAAGIFSDFGGTATTDIAGLISRFGAPFATDIRRLPKLIDETEDGEAVVEVLAALTALVWCATLIGVWPQWAAGVGEPTQDMDPLGLLGSAILVGGTTQHVHKRARAILTRMMLPPG